MRVSLAVVLQGGALLAALASLVLLIVLTTDYANRADAPNCNDFNPCTANLQIGPAPGWCHNPALPNNSACTSQCFAAGAAGKCNTGECRPTDLTKCKGYCAQDNDDIVDFEDQNGCDDLMLPLLIPGFYNDVEYNCAFNPDAIANNRSACVANVCTLTTFMATAYEEGFENPVRPSSFSFVPCEAMLVDGPHRHCVHALEAPLDSVWLSQILVDDGYDNVPYVGRMCTYIYNCGGFNMTAFSDPTYMPGGGSECKKKRAAVARPLAMSAGKHMGLGQHGHRVLEQLAQGVTRRF